MRAPNAAASAEEKMQRKVDQNVDIQKQAAPIKHDECSPTKKKEKVKEHVDLSPKKNQDCLVAPGTTEVSHSKETVAPSPESSIHITSSSSGGTGQRAALCAPKNPGNYAAILGGSNKKGPTPQPLDRLTEVLNAANESSALLDAPKAGDAAKQVAKMMHAVTQPPAKNTRGRKKK